ncbi:MAG: DUF3368 domain-containing protein [Verrucomicrobiae bacterium]|nr:DUF3368 domain-containing protein [Verrucomicrobiae bacterium]
MRLWAESLPPWADVQAPSESARFLDLGSGEREAIQLALDSGADFVLMDESVGRRVARQAGVRVKGTLGVLEDAADRNLIELREAIERLRATNIFIAEELIDGAVRRHETRRRTDDGPATSPTKGRDAGPLR